MKCSDLRTRAPGLASSPADDGERRAAYDHARTCAGCAGALREGERLLDLIAATPDPGPTAELLGRVSGLVHARLDAEARLRRRWMWAVPLAVAAGWSLLVSNVPASPAQYRTWLLSAAVVALAALGTLVTRGGALLAAGTAATAVLLSFLVGHDGPVHANVGLHCAALALATASLPLVVVAVLVARGRAVGDAGRFAFVAAAGALAGYAALALKCPVGAVLPHLLVFHTGAVLLASLLGAPVGLLLRRALRSAQ